MDILEQFNKNNVIKNLSYYEIYYQISLGKLLSISNVKTCDLDIEFQYALGSIYEVLSDIGALNDANEIFNLELKKQAAMDAMQKFVNDNLELVKNKTIKVDDLINEINDNKFFNESMNELAKTSFKEVQIKYKNLISDELSNQIITSLKDLMK